MELEEEKTPREEQIAPAKKARRPPRPKQCRAFVLKEVAKELPEIVREFVKEAKGGSVPHTRELMRISGLDKQVIAKKTVERREKSFAKLLMEELEREDAVGSQDPV